MSKETTIKKILELKKKRNAVILVHNYQTAEVQDIADYLGDSLELSRLAAETKADIIVFCGVHFMAETASILSPEKAVLLPELSAGCPMADMIDSDQLRRFKEEHPGAPVVAYVNTTAEVKAESDICCTSANAVQIVNSLDTEEVLFVPDKNLASYVARNTYKRIIPYDGCCSIHDKISAEDIEREALLHPNARILVHPECRPEVIDKADEVLSTSGMCRFAKESGSKEFIIGTEVGILHKLAVDNPSKKFYPVRKTAICTNMKMTTLEKVLHSLEELKYEVKVPEEIRMKASAPIQRMLAVSNNKRSQK